MLTKTLLVFMCGILLAAACGGSGPPPQFNVEDLQPGITLRTVQADYRRHGTADEVLALNPGYQPETVLIETWMEFDDDGKLTSMRSETRDEDGELWASARSDGDDIVYLNKDEEEHRRLPAQLSNLTIERYRAEILDASRKALAELENQRPDVAFTTLRSEDVFVLEERRPFTRTAMEASPTSYQVPYFFDLDLDGVDEIRRQYILVGAMRELRSEVVLVDSDGNETLLERSETLVVEVLPD